MLGKAVEKSQKATYVARPFWVILYCIMESRQYIASWICWPGRLPSQFTVSVLWGSVNLVNREIRIPSKSLANALLRYMPRYEAGSALDLLLPLQIGCIIDICHAVGWMSCVHRVPNISYIISWNLGPAV